ncbi:uncharacterized protein PgNI_03560 [Pyricularia grisea]|uniref:Uncharacterized protein n=1 Tax=Pyricularia grisea TaxID=148305 RepID=A0A6P8BER5_PYRGI|nr:uncharacterized protein PgNI_03560 [Pyricularia grisea]TLD14381.1 hypothetical protein PgNI_03560 [Pyricularia grisea]
MVRLMTATVAAVTVYICTAAATIDKPVLDPATNFTLIEERWMSVPNQPTVVVEWLHHYLPKACHDAALANNLSPMDFTASDVLTTSSATWARSPVGMRSYVRHVIAYPARKQQQQQHDAVASWHAPGDLHLHARPTMQTLIHQVAHEMDYAALPGRGSPFSESELWREAAETDRRRASEYAGLDWREHFAEAAVVAVFDQNFPHEIGSAQPATIGIANQLYVWQMLLGGQIQMGGRCTRRRENSPRVNKKTGEGDAGSVLSARSGLLRRSIEIFSVEYPGGGKDLHIEDRWQQVDVFGQYGAKAAQATAAAS